MKPRMLATAGAGGTALLLAALAEPRLDGLLKLLLAPAFALLLAAGVAIGADRVEADRAGRTLRLALAGAVAATLLLHASGFLAGVAAPSIEAATAPVRLALALLLGGLAMGVLVLARQLRR